MLIKSTVKVTQDTGPRPAGKPDECFYCQELVGSSHKPDCVCKKKVVMLKLEVTIPVVVPSDWNSDEIEFHRNENTWCADNVIDDLTTVLQARESSGHCMCNNFHAEYIRDATTEDLVGTDIEKLVSN